MAKKFETRRVGILLPSSKKTMGGTASRLNNKLSFSFDEYIREREELADLFREIAKAAREHREAKGTLQVINGASGVTAGIAGGVALALSPVTLGLSVPAAAVVTAAIVSNSLAAASLTSSVASYGFGHAGDRDIERRLENIQCMMNSISEKDQEVNKLLKCLEKENVEPVVKACHELRSSEAVDSLGSSSKDRRHAVDLPLSVIKSQGIVLGAHSIIKGNQQVQQEEELERLLTDTATKLAEETATIRSLDNRFKYICCIPGESTPPRGRLTYIDGGGGCSRTMVATFFDAEKQTTERLTSDSSNVLRLPEGATSLKVHFQVKGGTTVKKVDRSDPKQPWVKSEKDFVVDVFDFECSDGVDAVFLVQGTLTHSFVKKAWDFGRHSWTKPRSWEWWPNADAECKERLPDVHARLARRRHSSSYCCVPCCGIDLACGSCFGSSAVGTVEA